jgi:NAD(P)-dependent dehydrogenase (short-subunit alcohol dehydrogenase family)
MNDKVALITGASSGIGRATAEAFAARREPELAALTGEIESRGARASFVVIDGLTWIISRHSFCSLVLEEGALDENACVV